MKHCEYCNTPLVQRHDEKPNLFARRRFCTQSHAALARAANRVGKPKKRCLECRRAFYLHEGRSEQSKEWQARKFCTQKCSREYNYTARSSRDAWEPSFEFLTAAMAWGPTTRTVNRWDVIHAHYGARA